MAGEQKVLICSVIRDVKRASREIHISGINVLVFHYGIGWNFICWVCFAVILIICSDYVFAVLHRGF